MWTATRPFLTDTIAVCEDTTLKGYIQHRSDGRWYALHRGMKRAQRKGRPDPGKAACDMWGIEAERAVFCLQQEAAAA